MPQEEHEDAAEFIGNEDAMRDLRRYADDIDKGAKRRPIMLVGPPGTGKSMAAHLVSGERGWNVVELNASDYRDKESIDRLLLAAAQSRTIFGKKNVILLDEIDELAPRFDKGASSAIMNMLNNSKNPIIFTANDRWNQSISFLRSAVDYIEFRKFTSLTIAKILANYAKRNKLKVSQAMIDGVAGKSNGDARSAINDLSILDGAPEDAIEIIGMRDRKADIFQTLDKIFLSNTYSAPLAAAQNADVDNNMLMRWLDENIPKRYINKKDLSNAYEMLSTASMFATRASRAQYYTYWRYMSVMMSSGIALAKDNYPDKMQRYSFPKVVSSLSKSKEGRNKGLEIAKKLRKRIHSNTARIIKYEMPILADMVRFYSKDEEKSEQMYDFFMSRYGLDSKEVDWLEENIKQNV